MKKANVVLAVVAFLVIAAVFGVVYFNSIQHAETEVDLNQLRAEAQTPQPVVDKEKEVLAAIKDLSPETELSDLKTDFSSFSSTQTSARYMDATRSAQKIHPYFASLHAINTKDPDALKSGYNTLLAQDFSENDQQHLVALLEDLNLRGIDAGVEEIWCRTNLAKVYRVTGQIMLAVPQLKKVEEMDPDNIEAIYMLAELSLQSRQLEKARERFKKLVSLQPQNQNFRKSLLSICEELGDSECVESYSVEN